MPIHTPLQGVPPNRLRKGYNMMSEMGGKMLTVLTPPQQEKLRAEIARLEQDDP